jgi:hypothetical protein
MGFLAEEMHNWKINWELVGMIPYTTEVIKPDLQAIMFV